MDREDFETKVLETLVRLETQMRDLVGNGQPGRIAILEGQTTKNSRYINYMIGALGLVSVALGAIIAIWAELH